VQAAKEGLSLETGTFGRWETKWSELFGGDLYLMRQEGLKDIEELDVASEHMHLVVHW
jgi:hypothetical protein